MNFYIKCGSALEKLEKKKGNFKTVLFDLLNKNQISSQEFQKAYPILIAAVTHLGDIDYLISLLQEKKKVKFSNKNLFRIMMSELLFGKYKTIKGGGKLKKMLMEHKDFLEKELNIIFEKNPEKKKEIDFGIEKKKLIRSNVYLRIIENRMKVEELGIPAEDIKFEPIIPNLLNIKYEAYQKLRKQENYKMNSNYVIQSISSCLPAYFLCKILLGKEKSINKKIDIIDSCSAPGNKTTQLAEYWPNGRIFAVERDIKRFKLLQERIEFFDFKNVKCLNQSFLDLDPIDQKFKYVRFILCDPTCSGSGMINNMPTNIVEENQTFENYVKECYDKMDDIEKARILELKRSQLELLDHASKFPNLLRLSYSTCSIYEQENEEVVKEFLETHPNFTVINLSKYWGSGGFSSTCTKASKCIRVNPGIEGMDGFFVCLFKKNSV